jgi:hypothetical protein
LREWVALVVDPVESGVDAVEQLTEHGLRLLAKRGAAGALFFKVVGEREGDEEHGLRMIGAAARELSEPFVDDARVTVQRLLARGGDEAVKLAANVHLDRGAHHRGTLPFGASDGKLGG